MENKVYCPHCYKANVEFTTTTSENSIVLDDGVEYRYMEQVAVCCECGKPCLNEDYRLHNAVAFNNVVRAAHSCVAQWKIDDLFNQYGETIKSISDKLNIAPELVRALKNGVCPSREHSEILDTLWLNYAVSEKNNIPLISEIRSGGQTGVDRAAFDAAREMELQICGWCPQGGWAEDMSEPPGVLSMYPEMIETPSEQPEQRTLWNVRDSDAMLIYYDTHDDVISVDNVSMGTSLAKMTSIKRGQPMLIADDSTEASDVVRWLVHIGRDLTLSIGGPRESESPGIYKKAKKFFIDVFQEAKTK